MSIAMNRPFHISAAVENGVCALFRRARAFVSARRNRHRHVSEQELAGADRSKADPRGPLQRIDSYARISREIIAPHVNN